MTASRLDDVPAAVWALATLRKLELSYNVIVRVPVEVTQLSKLRSLDLSHNKIRVLPPLTAMTGLQTVCACSVGRSV